MIKPLSKAIDTQTVRRVWRFAFGPTHRLSHLHRGHALGIGLGQRRLGPRNRFDGEIGGVPTREEVESAAGYKQNDDESDCEFAKNSHICDR